jgi:hypothetical protein
MPARDNQQNGPMAFTESGGACQLGLRVMTFSSSSRNRVSEQTNGHLLTLELITGPLKHSDPVLVNAKGNSNTVQGFSYGTHYGARGLITNYDVPKYFEVLRTIHAARSIPLDGLLEPILEGV